MAGKREHSKNFEKVKKFIRSFGANREYTMRSQIPYQIRGLRRRNMKKSRVRNTFLNRNRRGNAWEHMKQ